MVRECHLISLNKELKLENIKKILGEDYSFIPPFLKEKENLEIEEKTLYNLWSEVEDVVVLNDNVRCLKAKGRMEVPFSSYCFKGTEEVKPKRDRVNTYNVEVIFLEIKIDSEKTLPFAVIATSNNVLKNIKSHLLGGARSFSKSLKNKWGWNKIEENKFLKFEPDFFLWLLIKAEKDELNEMEIQDIYYIDNEHETNERKHTDRGKGVLSDILAKVALSRDSKLLKLGIILECKYGKFHFEFDSNGNIEFSEESCLYEDEDVSITINDENKDELITYIYGYVFQELLSSYREDINSLTWRSQNIIPFKKKQGIKALIEMGKYLEIISIDEEQERKLVNGEAKIVIE